MLFEFLFRSIISLFFVFSTMFVTGHVLCFYFVDRLSFYQKFLIMLAVSASVTIVVAWVMTSQAFIEICFTSR